MVWKQGTFVCCGRNKEYYDAMAKFLPCHKTKNNGRWRSRVSHSGNRITRRLVT